MKDFLVLVIVLFVSCGIAAGSLSFINQITKDPISNFQKIEKLEAMKQVCKDADNFKVIREDSVWEAYRGEEKTGNVVQIQFQGYSGPVTMMFGFSNEAAVTGVHILNHTETPGLGAKIVKAEFTDQYIGKIADQLILKKEDSVNGTIDSITGATISSRAVTKAIREVLLHYIPENK